MGNQSNYEMGTEVNDPALRIVGYVFGAIAALLLTAVSMLPYMAAFPNPGAHARTAMVLLAVLLGILVCTAVVRSAISGHKHELKTFLLRTHQTFLFILLYLLIGGFGVLFLSIVNVIAGWSMIGVLVAATIIVTYRFYRCSHCRKIFAAELIGVERTGTTTSSTVVQGIYGGQTTVKEEVGVFSRTYRCRYCLGTWTR